MCPSPTMGSLLLLPRNTPDPRGRVRTRRLSRPRAPREPWEPLEPRPSYTAPRVPHSSSVRPNLAVCPPIPVSVRPSRSLCPSIPAFWAFCPSQRVLYLSPCSTSPFPRRPEPYLATGGTHPAQLWSAWLWSARLGSAPRRGGGRAGLAAPPGTDPVSPRSLPARDGPPGGGRPPASSPSTRTATRQLSLRCSPPSAGAPSPPGGGTHGWVPVGVGLPPHYSLVYSSASLPGRA